jgi:type II secretory ATPase GspE/PulE/Tfp pilus assembly ATPase PilB-like protein
MYPNIDELQDILVREDYISTEDSQAARSASTDSRSYIEYLIGRELLSRPLLGQALAESYHLPFADLGANPPGKEQVAKIPENEARTMRIVLARAEGDSFIVASDQPDKIDAKMMEKLFSGKAVTLAYTLPEYVEAALELYQQPLATRFSQIIAAGGRIAPEIVDEIVRDALGFKASDIHFEPRGGSVSVRFRVDGSLREAGVLPREYYDNILNRIKVASGMRIDEHLSAQDGSIQHQFENSVVDLRVSLVPTVEGEKIVMRVLGSYVQGLALGDIGLNEAHQLVLESSVAKPFGMILTVGPTGSGKTTTLYALLKMLNKSDVNITTIEDPVEYKMTGTNQIQVRDATNMTFAKGLRAIVRQDPDVILVGEIRDQETAEISVNAALTGHLLLSTFHANDAATAIPRLVDMGIEPFLLASTLEVIVAQRLVRRICNSCRFSLPVSEATKEIKVKGLDFSKYFGENDNVYAGKGCNVCGGSGYNGRSALFEMIQLTPEMRELLMDTPVTRRIEQQARKQGDKPMFDDGVDKVKRGLTTLAEVVRVVLPPATKAGE